jgi:ABC-type nitrate/sulfonate/bicarbonate transport system substrate-binding protein
MNTSPNGRECKTLRVGVFNGAWNLPLWIAQSRGFFESESLDVKVLPTRSSGALMQALYGDSLELALASADNFLAYESGMGEVHFARSDELRIVMGGDGGFLTLVAHGNVDSLENLRGQTIGVDAFTTGFAFVVRELLRRRNITESEVEWAALGGTDLRYAAFLQRKCDATLLRLPFELMAQGEGARLLASGDELGRYQGTAAAVRRRWAEQQPEVVVGFLRAYGRALQWCADDGNRAAATREIQDRLGIGSEELASAVLAQLMAPGGLQLDMRVDKAGLATVAELRERYGGLSGSELNPNQLIDETYLQAALRTA